MELSLRRITTEKWEVSNCICGAEPEVLGRASAFDSNQHYVYIKCPVCQKMAEGGSYIEHYNESTINEKYSATIMAITAWENSNVPKTIEGISEYCTKCPSVDKCIDHATRFPNTAIRCPCYGLLKLCVERSQNNETLASETDTLS
jgi:hypothetical protein